MEADELRLWLSVNSDFTEVINIILISGHTEEMMRKIFGSNEEWDIGMPLWDKGHDAFV